MVAEVLCVLHVFHEEEGTTSCGIEGRVAMAATSEGVTIGEHAGRAVDGGEVVSEEFLTEAPNLVEFAGVFEDFFEGAAIAYDVEVGSPEVASTARNGPAATADFTNEGVVVFFTVGTLPRAEEEGAEAGTLKKLVKGKFAGRGE